MIISGIVSRSLPSGRHVDISFVIDTHTGTYSQWGHDTMTLGENVELLEALRETACENT